jgi:hypothetical protein
METPFELPNQASPWKGSNVSKLRRPNGESVTFGNCFSGEETYDGMDITAYSGGIHHETFRISISFDIVIAFCLQHAGTRATYVHA